MKDYLEKEDEALSKYPVGEWIIIPWPVATGDIDDISSYDFLSVSMITVSNVGSMAQPRPEMQINHNIPVPDANIKLAKEILRTMKDLWAQHKKQEFRLSDDSIGRVIDTSKAGTTDWKSKHIERIKKIKEDENSQKNE